MPSINPQAVRGPVTAVPVVAGTGVRFVEDVPNNRVVAEVDETVLWTGSQSLASAVNITTLAESAENFEYIDVYYIGYTTTHGEQRATRFKVDSTVAATLFTPYVGGSNTLRLNFCMVQFTGTTASFQSPAQVYIKSGAAVGGANNNSVVTKIVGINRIASN